MSLRTNRTKVFSLATERIGEIMNNVKFLVKVNYAGTRVPNYVQRIDRIPVQMTTQRKLALIMGRFTAEDAAKSIQTARCIPELVAVPVTG